MPENRSKDQAPLAAELTISSNLFTDILKAGTCNLSVGAIAELLERLGTAKINVTAIDAVSVDGRYGAIFWVAPKDVKKAAALLGAA
jgi:hypothetical protein